MRIEKVKLNIVDDIPEIQDEEILQVTENLNDRISKSENDFKNGRYVRAEDLLAQYQK